jgi:hypothetical protein
VQAVDGRAFRVAVGAAIVVGVAISSGCSRSSEDTGASLTTQSSRTSETPAGTGATAFARCMRRNGVKRFPDPRKSGRAQPPRGFSSPTFSEAQRACARYADETEPNELSSVGRAQAADAMLALARCFRQQGVRMRDPIITQDKMVLRLPAGLATGDPAVEQARATCASTEERVLKVIGRYPGDPGTGAKRDY